MALGEGQKAARSTPVMRPAGIVMVGFMVVCLIWVCGWSLQERIFEVKIVLLYSFAIA